MNRDYYMEIKRKHIVIIILSMIIVIFCVFNFIREFIVTYDILVQVKSTGGWIGKSIDTYYEISSKWGIKRKINKLPDETKYILTAYDYESYERFRDKTDYSYIKQYDSLMDYDSNNTSSVNDYFAANIGGYVYYFRKNDKINFYKFSTETQEIKQIPIETINKIILGNEWKTIKDNLGAIKKLGYFDYYQGLNEVMAKHINDQNRYFSIGIFNVSEVNGRVFFRTRTALFEFYPDTKTAKFIMSISFAENKSFSIIGTY